ncbi:hypothetical protein PGB90_008657 [Kerria lacca]
MFRVFTDKLPGTVEPACFITILSECYRAFAFPRREICRTSDEARQVTRRGNKALEIGVIDISDKFRKDPRLVQFAKTLPGPSFNSDLFLADSSRIQKILQTYSEKYGSTYRFWLGKYLLIGISNIEDLQVVLHQTETLSKPKFFQYFVDYFGIGLFSAPLHLWKKNRKRLQPFFAKNVLKYHIKTINESISKYVKLIENHANGPEFDIYQYLPSLAFESFIRVYFGLTLNEKYVKYFNFHEILNAGGHYGILRIFVFWLRCDFIANFYFKKILNVAKKKNKEFFEIMKKNEFDPVKKEPILKHREMSLFSVSRSLEEEWKLENLIKDEMFTFTAAASETTAVTNSFLFLILAMYPNIQKKLYDEIIEVLGQSSSSIDISDIERLSYLDQVIKEVQRRFTLVPFIFRSNESTDIKLASMTIPAGANIMIRINDLHLNPDFYPDPYKFNPDNFHPKAVSKRSKYSFIPFSTGSRDCIGKIYANTVIKLTVIIFLRNFTFHTTTKLEDIELETGFVSKKKGGYFLSIRLRKD